MIFIILGTQKFQLNRLLKQIDGLVNDGIINDTIIAQIGQSDYKPKNFAFHRFIDKAEFDRLISEADLIISHGGVSSIVSAMKCGKPIIVFPRLAKFGEHVDDHQKEIAYAFAKKGFVLCCGENDSIEEQIALCKNWEFSKYISQTDNITKIINNYLVNF